MSAQGSYALSVGYSTEKKKRGRPCKAEGSRQRGRRSAASVNEKGEIGQTVTGVVDGIFGAGYLLSVRVGEAKTLLRGAAFMPSLFAPITVENDVAPELVTYKRKRSRRVKVNSQPSDADPSLSGKLGVEDQPAPINMVLASEVPEQDKVLSEILNPSSELPVDLFADAGVDPDKPSGVHDQMPLQAIRADADAPEADHQALLDDMLLNEPELMDCEPLFEPVNNLMELTEGEGNPDVSNAVSFSAVKDVASEIVPLVGCGVVTAEPEPAMGSNIPAGETEPEPASGGNASPGQTETEPERAL